MIPVFANLQSTAKASDDYQIIFNSYSSAVSEVMRYAKDKGLEVSEDDIFNQITVGKPKPKDGDTNKFSLAISKDGKLLRKALQVQITGVGQKYELNMYTL